MEKIIRVLLRSCGYNSVVHCWRAFDAKGEFVVNLQLKDEGIIWARGRSTEVLEAVSKLVGSAG
jgi:hypothetical protein